MPHDSVSSPWPCSSEPAARVCACCSYAAVSVGGGEVSANVRPRGETRREVLSLLVREADLDGIVVLPVREMAEAVGTSSVAVQWHLAALEESGLIESAGEFHVDGRVGAPINAYRVSGVSL